MIFNPAIPSYLRFSVERARHGPRVLQDSYPVGTERHGLLYLLVTVDIMRCVVCPSTVSKGFREPVNRWTPYRRYFAAAQASPPSVPDATASTRSNPPAWPPNGTGPTSSKRTTTAIPFDRA